MRKRERKEEFYTVGGEGGGLSQNMKQEDFSVLVACNDLWTVLSYDCCSQNVNIATE